MEAITTGTLTITGETTLTEEETIAAEEIINKWITDDDLADCMHTHHENNQIIVNIADKYGLVFWQTWEDDIAIFANDLKKQGLVVNGKIDNSENGYRRIAIHANEVDSMIGRITFDDGSEW